MTSQEPQQGRGKEKDLGFRAQGLGVVGSVLLESSLGLGPGLYLGTLGLKATATAVAISQQKHVSMRASDGHRYSGS